jgi:hypothetical protein
MTSRLEKTERPATWGFIFRVILKAALLFALCNLAFTVLMPVESLGQLSLYNTLLPGRERLPYGENSAQSYNLSLYNIPAMMNSHIVARPKAPDEFRLLLIGDSATWGWFLENKDTLAGRLNAGGYHTASGKRLIAYNLGYPIMSLTKDLLLLDAAMQVHPDMIVWLVTLESFPRDKQLAHPILQNNSARVRRLIETHPLKLDPRDARFVEPDFLGRTIVGQRRALADWLRLQLYGVSWAATGIDQAIPHEIPLRQSDFDGDIRWQNSTGPLAEDALAFDVLAAGVQRAGDVPVLIVNEPMYISSGKNSQLRYNSFYPRWAYDAYRQQLFLRFQASGWHVLDAWESIASNEFTNTPVHLTPKGSAQLAEQASVVILRIADQGAK